MKVVLVFPYYSKSTETGIPKFLQRMRGKYPPLGVAWVASSLETSGHEVEIIDAEAEELSFYQMGERLRKSLPGIIGISSTTETFPVVKKTAQFIKSKFPNIPIIIGGPQVSVFPKISLEFPFFDFGVVGEAEKTIVELINTIEKGGDLNEIKGIVYKEKDRIIQTAVREYIQNLDKIPLPAWHLLPMKKYRDIMTKREGYSIMVTSRGCPFKCIFCEEKGRLGRKFRYRSPENIISEILLLYNDYGIREICFYDDTFTINKARVHAICDEIIKKNLDIIWECRTRVDTVDERLLQKMALAGCYRIRYGVESGNDELLKVLKKGITKEQVRRTFNISRKNNIEIIAYFMLGVPMETVDTVRETIDFALGLNPDYVLFNNTILSPPGSDLVHWAARSGYIVPDYWERFCRGEFTNAWPKLLTEKFDEKTLKKYSDYAYRKFYIRPKFIFRMIKKLDFFTIKKYFSLLINSMKVTVNGK